MVVSRGFSGRRRASADLPPGQYLTEDFPVLTAGPTQRVPTDTWELTVTSEAGQVHRWDWSAFRALPAETPTVDLHCVTSWSKLATDWRGVALDTLLLDVETTADFALITSYGGYSTNVPLEDLTDGQAWVAFEFDGEDLPAANSRARGRARVLGDRGLPQLR